ncbi:molecular chaperone HtpG [Planctomycetaceae bacterium SCGC AG-212-F19]|nr:molecular chaperone HtpG [Planctomycetaceae bacterium SCGC AG-212-F19]
MSAETLQFKTELKQVLDIIIHSLYSHKDIFLRELISNASDAIDTLRFEALTRPELKEAVPAEFKIKLVSDLKAGTLTVSDNGIGMSRHDIVENLGTIAKSGTRAFLENLKSADVKQRPELIGQFGVGFYSAFMVADKVTVVSRKAGEPAAAGVRWESDGAGAFTVDSLEKPTAGTDVVLHLREEDREYLQQYRLREIVKKYSDFVAHPIVIDVEKEENKEKKVVEETLNSQKAIWLRPKAEVTKEEYDEFYKHIAHDFEPPAKVIHYAAEGMIEFKALLYVPAHKTVDLMWGDARNVKGLHLYIQRVFIMDDCETLLPLYLRFVKGVVDSPDLPLNVSRELLQQSAPLEKIKSNLTNKILNTLEEWMRQDYDAYVKFFGELGMYLKEGVSHDWTNRQKLADLMLVESTKTEPGKFTTLTKYVDAMAPDQKEIFYLTGENRELLEQSPYLEAFRSKGWEVLLLTDPMDEFVVQALTEYKKKPLKAVDRGALDGAGVDEAKKKSFGPLLEYIKGKLPEIKEARLSNRLKESAACLVADEHAPGAHMERLLHRMGRGQELPEFKRILEVNPDHPAISALWRLFAADSGAARLEQYVRLIYDEAVIAEGSKLKDPLAFAKRINELIVKDAGV